MREERDVHVARTPAARDGDDLRPRALRRHRPARALAAATPARPRTRDLVRLPGADDVAQPGVHRGAADRRGAAPAPRPLAPRGPEARARAAAPRADPCAR